MWLYMVLLVLATINEKFLKVKYARQVLKCFHHLYAFLYFSKMMKNVQYTSMSNV